MKTMLLLVGLPLLLVGVYTSFTSAVRDEIYYLCGNFTSGDCHSSVLRQLETANFSDYKSKKAEQGKRVIHSSAFHLNLARSEMVFADGNAVNRAICTYLSGAPVGSKENGLVRCALTNSTLAGSLL